MNHHLPRMPTLPSLSERLPILNQIASKIDSGILVGVEEVDVDR